MKERSQQLLRKAPPGHMGPVVFKVLPGCSAEVPVHMPPPQLPVATHDARVEALSRRFKKALSELQEEADLNIVLEGLLKDQRNMTRYDILKVLELSQKQHGQKSRFTTGWPDSDCIVKWACKEEEEEEGNDFRRKESAIAKMDGPDADQSAERQDTWKWKREESNIIGNYRNKF